MQSTEKVPLSNPEGDPDSISAASCRIVPHLNFPSMSCSLHIRIFNQTCPLTQDSNMLARTHMLHTAQAM